MTKRYTVHAIVKSETLLTYTIEADSKKQARQEILEGGYVPDDEEELGDVAMIIQDITEEEDDDEDED